VVVSAVISDVVRPLIPVVESAPSASRSAPELDRAQRGNFGIQQTAVPAGDRADLGGREGPELGGRQLAHLGRVSP